VWGRNAIIKNRKLLYEKWRWYSKDIWNIYIYIYIYDNWHKIRLHTNTLKKHLYFGSEIWTLNKTDVQEIKATQWDF
jgi:hypothetical protein